jgi:hypothetical protein
MAKRLALAIMKLALGIMSGWLLLEAILQVNAGLLLRGMAVPAPVDTPLSVSEYEVFTSDADVFYWHSDLIRPVSEEENLLEAQVRFETDEFGFPNAAPLPSEVDVIVLGRSYSLGAQAVEAWPRKLAGQSGLHVLNLSQTGSGMETKMSYMRRFGWLRKPKWIIVEVLPSMDILGYAPATDGLVKQLPEPLIRAFWKPIATQNSIPPPSYLYPLRVDIPDQQVSLTFFSVYLSALTADRRMVEASHQWVAYTAHLRELKEAADEHSACVMLLYVPTKEYIYFSLATAPEQLAGALTQVTPWKLDETGNLIQDNTRPVSIPGMQANGNAMRELLKTFAEQQHVFLVDPTEQLEEAALHGTDPFMRYDTHWSDTGHTIIAHQVTEALQQATCP